MLVAFVWLCLFDYRIYCTKTLSRHCVAVDMGFLSAVDPVRRIYRHPDYCVAAFGSQLFCKVH